MKLSRGVLVWVLLLALFGGLVPRVCAEPLTCCCAGACSGCGDDCSVQPAPEPAPLLGSSAPPVVHALEGARAPMQLVSARAPEVRAPQPAPRSRAPDLSLSPLSFALPPPA